MTIGLIDTGCANLASVRFALDRVDVDYRIAADPAGLDACDRLILPGVGAAAAAMTKLRASGWAERLAGDTRPLLGICLGMQLLFERSEEGDVDCLGLIPGTVRKLPAGEGLVWPHMGWNTLEIDEDDALLTGVEPGAHVYFVHGFYLPPVSGTCASTRYGTAITAVVRSGHVMGCQFHPERSGAVGARILANFAEMPA